MANCFFSPRHDERNFKFLKEKHVPHIEIIKEMHP